MTGTVHTQAFMMSFRNILVKTGVRPEVAGQVIAKLHALEAQAVAYPINRAYPTPTLPNAWYCCSRFGNVGQYRKPFIQLV